MGEALLAATPRLPRRPSDGVATLADAGLSLIELLVTMAIMSTIGTMFTTAAIQMFRAQNDTITIGQAQTQVNLAFIRLDQEIRYASGISEAAGGAYVEFLRTDQLSPVCTELWLDPSKKELKSRSWIQVTGATPPLWANVAPMMSNVTSAKPFTRTVAEAPSYHQSLQLQLSVGAEGTAGRSKGMNATFTASNTSYSTVSDAVCTEGRTQP